MYTISQLMPDKSKVEVVHDSFLETDSAQNIAVCVESSHYYSVEIASSNVQKLVQDDEISEVVCDVYVLQPGRSALVYMSNAAGCTLRSVPVVRSLPSTTEQTLEPSDQLNTPDDLSYSFSFVYEYSHVYTAKGKVSDSGWNGGGQGSALPNESVEGGGGGGASDIRLAFSKNAPLPLSRLVVAGGGGGAGGCLDSNGGNAGIMQGLSGGVCNSNSTTLGLGGTQDSGRKDGQGGDGRNGGGGGGGGGYYDIIEFFSFFC